MQPKSLTNMLTVIYGSQRTNTAIRFKILLLPKEEKNGKVTKFSSDRSVKHKREMNAFPGYLYRQNPT